jgi:HD-GYP domain-containing protein (c-di-GMP phosphodiesterase class II)
LHPEIDQLRPKLKEILYDCAVEIKATKAALYLLDPAVRKFELVTEYGFRSAIPQTANYNHPLVARVVRGRQSFYVNSVGADPKLSQLLFDGGSERLLVAPLFSRGDLVGMIDMRDKAAKAPFEHRDLAKAQTVVEKLLNVFASRNIFNQRFVTLADVAVSTAPTEPVPAIKEPAVAALPSVEAGKPVVNRPSLQEVIAESKRKTAGLRAAPEPKTVGEGELRAVRDVLRSILHLPGSLVAAFTSTGAPYVIQEISAKNTLSDDAREELRAKLDAWLSKRGESVGVLRPLVQTPMGEAGDPITASQLQKVYTAPVNAAGYRGVYLTVAFGETPSRSTHELMAALLNQLQQALEVSNSRDELEQIRKCAARKLLDSDFNGYPELSHHSDEVASLASALAQYLDLTPQEVETVTLTALVHDVGLRVLDYERLYTKRDISANELELLRQHVTVGAAMVEPFLGQEIARAVLCHHERVDGSGYPNELSGEEIPLSSRIVQICDAYVTITDPTSYHRTMTREDAVATITRGAGAQFDAGLVAKFAEMMKG